MKYAFMSFSCPELGLKEMLALAKRFGYDGVEPRIDSKHKHGIEIKTSAVKRRTLRKTAEDSGIALCCLATSCKYADPDTTERQVDETIRCIDLAADVGAPRIRVFGGALGAGLAREAAIDLLTRSFRKVAEHAQSRGVTVCMETHDEWTDPAHVAAIMAQVNHPAIAVNWDIMHPVRSSGKTMDEAFAAVRPWIRHVHFHDGADRGGKLLMVPIGQGIIDHRRAVELLDAMNYDGYLSGEWINWEPYENHLPRELAMMKSYERSKK